MYSSNASNNMEEGYYSNYSSTVPPVESGWQGAAVSKNEKSTPSSLPHNIVPINAVSKYSESSQGSMIHQNEIAPAKSLKREREYIECKKFEYSINKLGVKDRVIIAFEFQDEFLVRTYTCFNKKSWRCMECWRKGKTYTYAKITNGLLQVELNHNCRPKTYKSVKEEKFQKNNDKNSTPTIQQLNASLEANKIANDSIHIANMNMEIANNNLELQANFEFIHPSTIWLKESCKKLGINYSLNAYKLWSQIEIETFNFLSLPNTYISDEDIRVLERSYLFHPSGFECLSYLFSGSDENAYRLQKSVKDHFYSNYKYLGQCLNIDFTKLEYSDSCIKDTLFAENLTPIHCEMLAKWLHCRIVIFQTNNFYQYGDWNACNYDIVTLLIAEDEKGYHIIKSLK